jgi:hypothetical protein
MSSFQIKRTVKITFSSRRSGRPKTYVNTLYATKGRERGKGEEEGTSTIRLFLRDFSIAAGGHLGWAKDGSFY